MVHVCFGPAGGAVVTIVIHIKSIHRVHTHMLVTITCGREMTVTTQSESKNSIYNIKQELNIL